MTYEEKSKIYAEEFGIEGLDIDSLFKMFNLVGVIWTASKVSNPNIKVYDVLNKVLKTEMPNEKGEMVEVPWDNFDSFKIPFSIQLEFLCNKNFFKPDSLGLNTLPEVISEINKTMKLWVPF